MQAPKQERKQFDPVPAGNHVARLYQILHIGTIPVVWEGKETLKDKVRLTFELSNKKKVFKEGEPEKPFSISREFTFSMAPKSALRPFIESMLGIKFLNDGEATAFDFENLNGQECLLNVVHKNVGGVIYANIQAATPIPDGMPVPSLFNPWSMLDVKTMPKEDIDTLPEFLRNKIQSSNEYMGRFGTNPYAPKQIEVNDNGAADIQFGAEDIPF